MAETTTIKLYKNTKRALDDFKGTESYDEAIKSLIAKIKQTHLKTELIEAYKRIGKKELEFLGEWEVASQEVEEYD